MPLKKILLLTRTHPDFLPPVYAVAQVLRDEGYHIDIVCFESNVPGAFDPGNDITVTTLGRYDDKPLRQKIGYQFAFINKAQSLADDTTAAVIAFCAFSFLVALKVKQSPAIYIALETSNYSWEKFRQSPLSVYYNRKAIKSLHRAALVATPSIQRSAWLAGMANLGSLPYTIFNTAYCDKSGREKEMYKDLYRSLVPADFIGKKIFLYTGNVNSSLCMHEFVQGYCMSDNDSRLIITGIKDNPYGNAIRQVVADAGKNGKVLLLPSLSREKMLALQANADIGICFSRELDDVIESKMVAPNKVGEYISNGCLVIGNDVFYLQKLAADGIAVLSDSIEPRDIANAISTVLQRAAEAGAREKVRRYFETSFCMQRQLEPVLNYLKRSSHAGR